MTLSLDHDQVALLVAALDVLQRDVQAKPTEYTAALVGRVRELRRELQDVYYRERQS